MTAFRWAIAAYMLMTLSGMAAAVAIQGLLLGRPNGHRWQMAQVALGGLSIAALVVAIAALLGDPK